MANPLLTHTADDELCTKLMSENSLFWRKVNVIISSYCTLCTLKLQISGFMPSQVVIALNEYTLIG